MLRILVSLIIINFKGKYLLPCNFHIERNKTHIIHIICFSSLVILQIYDTVAEPKIIVMF